MTSLQLAVYDGTRWEDAAEAFREGGLWYHEGYFIHNRDDLNMLIDTVNWTADIHGKGDPETCIVLVSDGYDEVFVEPEDIDLNKAFTSATEFWRQNKEAIQYLDKEL